MIQLAIAAIFRNEAKYLPEWIEFHRSIGVEHFFLFDNLSGDDPKKILKPYRDFVTLTRWPFDHTCMFEWAEIQCLAYERAIHMTKGKVKWVAFFDLDEFLFSPSENVLDVLAEFEPYGGIGVNWQIFGTGGVKKAASIIGELFLKMPKETGTNHHVKSIVRPERVESCNMPHFFFYTPPFCQVDTHKVPFEGAFSSQVHIDRLRINHYILRDEEYWETEKIPRLQKWWGESADYWRLKYAGMNQIEDKTILDIFQKRV